ALIINVSNSLFDTRNLQQFENIDFEEQQKQLAVETAQKQIRDTWRMYLMLAGLFIILIIVVILWRNNRHRRIANDQLSMQKNSLESALSDLKSAQSRLIHSEKMASLGELTAGIAHEIQNPLNFVNNFSEVNSELAAELEAAAENGDLAEIKSLAKDIRENETKINHHGKRADAIVKGMLQHSRSGSGVKEPTDINALCDEYLRLAYHGLRSKDKSFNATIRTDFDKTLGKINVIPHDIARVILNLINNAFYTVGQKQGQKIVGYHPIVSLSTTQSNNHVEIRVTDNGNGIPQNVVDKIFQPFFTTKPTGQGTGLGLSISYDIVKAHGGELKVETKEGEGSEFFVLFPHS
ncbi:MAG TPA: ATP-binding protein, partial [Chitinophagaceae bacterium]|nr:ATP-binding protein [Chitinophagaceae bacterium]